MEQDPGQELQSRTATEIAWEARAHLLGFRSCDPETAQAQRALKLAQECFGELCQRTYDRLTASVLPRTNYNAEVTADIVQETYERAWKYLPSFKQESTVETWLTQISFSRLSTFYKKAAKYKPSPMIAEMVERVAGDRVESTTTVQLESAHEQYLHHVNRDMLVRILSEAPITATQRLILIRHHVLGYSHAEIGEQLGKTEAATKVQLSRAKKRILEYVNEVRNRHS